MLAEAAARIREAAGTSTFVARYGGEEFALLLPLTGKKQAVAVAKQVLEELSATPIDVGGARLTVRISAGVATYPEDAVSREDLLRNADHALYQAKRGGRDRVEAYSRAGK